jgi:Bacterial regulatory proteins, tetR family
LAVNTRKMIAIGPGRRPVYWSRACQARAYRSRKNPPVPALVEEEPAGRRGQIAETVWRIAAERGLERATVREIAAEAGVSPRVVQYHFTSKHHLMVTALRMLHRENERRARDPSPIPRWRWSSCTTGARWRTWSPP